MAAIINLACTRLKTNKARAVRSSTLDALCRELYCQPGDLLERVPENSEEAGRP